MHSPTSVTTVMTMMMCLITITAAFVATDVPRHSTAVAVRGSSLSHSSSSTMLLASNNWSPEEAKDYIGAFSSTYSKDFHVQVGKQIQPMVTHWGGEEMAEFLHLKSPHGYDRIGSAEFETLLQEMLPKSTLSDPVEIAICANSFLCESRCSPSGMPGSGFICWSHGSRGRSPELGSLLRSIRKNHTMEDWSPNEVVRMMTARKKPPRPTERFYYREEREEEFGGLEFNLTLAESAQLVERLASLDGCNVLYISMFMETCVNICEKSSASPDEIVRRMIAKDMSRKTKSVVPKAKGPWITKDKEFDFYEFHKGLGIELRSAERDYVVAELLLQGWEQNDVDGIQRGVNMYGLELAG